MMNVAGVESRQGQFRSHPTVKYGLCYQEGRISAGDATRKSKQTQALLRQRALQSAVAKPI